MEKCIQKSRKLESVRGPGFIEKNQPKRITKRKPVRQGGKTSRDGRETEKGETKKKLA